MRKVLANHLGGVFQSAQPLSKSLHKKSSNSIEWVGTRIHRTFEGIDPIEESYPNSPMALQKNEAKELEDQQPRRLRRALSAKDIFRWQNPLISDEQPLIRRKNSEKSFVSVRSTCRTLTKFQSGAESTVRKLFEGANFFTTSSPTPSHGFSLTELAQNELTATDISAFHKRAEELVNELLKILRLNYSRFDNIVPEGKTSSVQLDNHLLNEKTKEVLESLIGNSNELGTIEWETKLESFKKELNAIVSQKNVIMQSLQSTLMNLVKESKTSVQFDLAANAKLGKMEILVKELVSLLYAKKRMIHKLDAQRKSYDNEKHSLQALLGSKEEELSNLKGKVEKLDVENKHREAVMQSQLSELAGNRTLLEAVNKENLSLIETQKQEKQELQAKHSANLSNIQMRLSCFERKAQAVDDASVRLAARQQEKDNLNKQLQTNREKIQRLRDKIATSRQSSEERISQEKIKLESALTDLKKQQLFELQQKSQEISRLKAEREHLLDLSVLENKTIKMLNSDAALLKKRMNDLNHSHSFREYSFKVESNQLNKKLAELSQALQNNRSSVNSQSISVMSSEAKQTNSKLKK